MCFNTESSITVFFIGIICSIALFHRSIKNNSKIDFFSSILLILITSMQLIEYVLWQNQVCNDRNRIASYFIAILLFLQPIIYYILLHKLYSNKLTSRRKYINIFIVSIGALIFSYYFINKIYPNKNLCSLENKATGRIEWAPLKIISHSIFWFLILNILYFGIPCLIRIDEDIHFIRKNFLLITISIAIIYSIYKTGKNFYSVFGSLWCFLAVFYGIVCLIFPAK